MYPAEFTPLPAVTDIIQMHPNVFKPAADGDFITCMDCIQGNLVFVPGNHDMVIDLEVLKEYFDAQSRNHKKLVCADSDNLFYKSGKIYAEHGNKYSYFNVEDFNPANQYAPLPLGYYTTRLSALSCEQHLPGGQDCSQFDGNLYPGLKQMALNNEKKTFDDIVATLKDKMSIAQLILDMQADYCKQPDYSKLMIAVAHNKAISIAEVTSMMSYLKVPLPDSLANIEEIIPFLESPDIEGQGDLDKFAEKKFSDQTSIVIMGHTHVPLLKTYKGKQNTTNLYVNSGFTAPDQVRMKAGTSFITFVAVEDTGAVDVNAVQFSSLDIMPLYTWEVVARYR